MQSKDAVCLTDVERARLRTLIGAGTAPARELAHARILLKADQGEGGPGWHDTAIAGALAVCTRTVARVRQPSVTQGLDAARTRRRPARVDTRKLDGQQEAHLIALACSTPPTGRQRWRLRLLTDALVRLEIVDTVAHETVRQPVKHTT